MAPALGGAPASAAVEAKAVGGLDETSGPPPSQRPSPPPFRLTVAPANLPFMGAYAANDVPSFTLDSIGDQIRLRFVGSEEVFYLTNDPAPLGGRYLKYDTGEVVLSVAGWGGVTLYTDDVPSGIPAELRSASAPQAVSPLVTRPVETLDMKALAAQLSKDVSQQGLFRIGFSADFETLSRENESTRVLAADALRNAAYALEQMADEQERAAAAKALRSVRVNPAAEPAVAVHDDTLIVTFAPAGGPSARPSSLAIARVLAQEF
jgi:hypothetical protein